MLNALTREKYRYFEKQVDLLIYKAADDLSSLSFLG